MKILQHVQELRDKAVSHGDYRLLAKKSGVGFHWLQKFACGVITNPKVDKIEKLEIFFDQSANDSERLTN